MHKVNGPLDSPPKDLAEEFARAASNIGPTAQIGHQPDVV
jgi:hypothetical protein